MIEPLKENWTIVILGTWNTAIFNPGWLTAHVFQAKETSIDIGIQPGLPRRITGDNVVLIPTNARLMLAPKDLEDATLVRMEEMACEILRLLPHTPVNSVGINFGYKVSPMSEELRNMIPDILSTQLASEGLVIRSREYKWACQYEKPTLNISFKADDEEAIISYNFHLDVKDSNEAAEYIGGKVICFREKTKEVLQNVFDITMED